MNKITSKLFLTKLKYIIARKKHEKVILALNSKDKTNAIFNDYANYQIIKIINNLIAKKDPKAYKLLKDEIGRIDSLTESYCYGIIEPMTYEEMKSIINYYTDDIWSQKKTEQSLKKLFKITKEKPYKNNKKILNFPKKRTNV